MTRHDAFSDLDAELDATRRVLERLPDDHLDFRPHEKSWTLGELATHIASLPGWMGAAVTTDGLDLAGMPRQDALPSRDAIVERFDASAEGARAAWETADDEGLAGAWALRHGTHTLWSRPRHEVLRSTGLSHLVHHRGQLTVYLRMLDVPLPGLYGPSADER